MLKMKRVGHKGSRKGKSKSKRGSRERTAARKERKATQTLAIVLGEKTNDSYREPLKGSSQVLRICGGKIAFSQFLQLISHNL